MRIGYIRVSSTAQNPDRQLHGIETEKVFLDKASGKNTDRPQLQAMLEFARAGDQVFVHSMDRMARNLDDLKRIVQLLKKKGIEIHFLREGLILNQEDSALSDFLLTVIGAVAQLENNIREENRNEGIARAKARGVYKGRKPKLAAETHQELHKLWEKQPLKSNIAKTFNLHRHTVDNYLKRICGRDACFCVAQEQPA